MDTVGDRAPIEKSSEQRLTARKRTGIEPAGRSLSRGPIGFEDRAGHQPRKRLRWRHYPEAPWCCDLLGEPAQTVLVASVSSPKAQAFAQAARGLAGDLDGVAARGARSVADHLGWLEANDVGEVDQGAAVDTREAVAAEADLQLLQRQGAQVLRVAGVDGDSSPSRSAWVTSRGSSSSIPWRVGRANRSSGAAAAGAACCRASSSRNRRRASWSRARSSALRRRAASMGFSR